jgi:hypothetical protein
VPDRVIFSHNAQQTPTVVKGTVLVNRDFLPDRNALFLLRWPFLGDDWSLDFRSYDPEIRVAVSRYSPRPGFTGLIFSGAAFADGVTVVLDRTYGIAAGELERVADLLRLVLPTERVASHNECFVCQPPSAAVRVHIPRAALSVEPSLDETKLPVRLVTGQRGPIDLFGTALDTVVRARLDDTALSFVPKASGGAVTVIIDRALTLADGKHEIRLYTESGKELTAEVEVAPPTKKGDKP